MANRKGLKYLEEIVEKSQLTNKGIVLNGVRLKRWKYYYGKYGTAMATAMAMAMATVTVGWF